MMMTMTQSKNIYESNMGAWKITIVLLLVLLLLFWANFVWKVSVLVVAVVAVVVVAFVVAAVDFFSISLFPLAELFDFEFAREQLICYYFYAL